MSLKQQALNHKNFLKFQTDYFNEVNEHNLKIDKKLKDPKTQKELDFLIKKYSISEKIRQYKNPFYFYAKYPKNYKFRKEIKLFKRFNFLSRNIYKRYLRNLFGLHYLIRKLWMKKN